MEHQQPAVELAGLTKRYDPAQPPAVESLDLRVPRGALLALLGPSGCGKTTTLRLIAGLEAPDAGTVALEGRAVAGPGTWVPPAGRGVGLVFQDGALFPHLTAAQNVAFGLDRLPPAERRARASALLEVVGMAGMGGRFPHQLSGGQQQRVALARALAPGPRVLLLDEPFANLDAALRRDLRAEVARLVRAAGATAVLVTHDREEALSTADVLAVMFGGRLAQVGAPPDVYERPATAAVAAFVGEANFLPGEAGGGAADCALGRVALASEAQGPVTLLARPEQLAVEMDEGGPARIEEVTYFGHDQVALVRLAGGEGLRVRARPRAELRAGGRARVTAAAALVAFRREGA